MRLRRRGPASHKLVRERLAQGAKGRARTRDTQATDESASATTDALSLSERRLPVPRRIATQYVHKRTATGGTSIRHSDGVIHIALSRLAPCMMDSSSRICSQGLPDAWINLRYDGERRKLQEITPHRLKTISKPRPANRRQRRRHKRRR